MVNNIVYMKYIKLFFTHTITYILKCSNVSETCMNTDVGSGESEFQSLTRKALNLFSFLKTSWTQKFSYEDQ